MLHRFGQHSNRQYSLLSRFFPLFFYCCIVMQLTKKLLYLLFSIVRDHSLRGQRNPSRSFTILSSCNWSIIVETFHLIGFQWSRQTRIRILQPHLAPASIARRSLIELATIIHRNLISMAVSNTEYRCVVHNPAIVSSRHRLIKPAILIY